MRADHLHRRALAITGAKPRVPARIARKRLMSRSLYFLIFADNLLGRIEGHEATGWFWPSPGRWELICVSGVLSVVCQLLSWRRVVLQGNRRARGE